MEPMTSEDTRRFVLFPIRYPAIWDFYKEVLSSFWVCENVDIVAVTDSCERTMTANDKRVLCFVHALACLAASDNSALRRLCTDITIPEARCYFGLQLTKANIHVETFSKLLTALVPSEHEQTHFLDIILEAQVASRKLDWISGWVTNPDVSLNCRVFAYIITKTIFCASGSAVLGWMKDRMLAPELIHAHFLISRDETYDTDFACLLFHHLQEKTPKDLAIRLVNQATNLEKTFFQDFLLAHLDGIAIDIPLMNQFIDFTGDRLLHMLGFHKLYDAQNPFLFVNPTPAEVKLDFFSRQIKLASRFNPSCTAMEFQPEDFVQDF